MAATCDASNALDVTPYLEELSKNPGGGGAALDPDYLQRIIDNAVKRRVKRATLDCKSSETCVALQGFPLCFDIVAYTWRDAAGDNGNLMDGSYTLSDGRKGNLYTGPYPLPEGANTSMPAGASNTMPAGASETTPATTPTSNSSGDDSAKTGMPDATTTGGSTTSAPPSSQTPNGGVKVGGSMGLAIAAAGGALAVLL
ncbi:hypothetical protein TWF281_003327 [Arthrobotrys megalospora]